MPDSLCRSEILPSRFPILTFVGRAHKFFLGEHGV
jgi:hypothetical protein